MMNELEKLVVDRFKLKCVCPYACIKCNEANGKKLAVRRSLADKCSITLPKGHTFSGNY